MKDINKATDIKCAVKAIYDITEDTPYGKLEAYGVITNVSADSLITFLADNNTEYRFKIGCIEYLRFINESKDKLCGIGLVLGSPTWVNLKGSFQSYFTKNIGFSASIGIMPKDSFYLFGVSGSIFYNTASKEDYESNIGVCIATSIPTFRQKPYPSNIKENAYLGFYGDVCSHGFYACGGLAFSTDDKILPIINLGVMLRFNQ